MESLLTPYAASAVSKADVVLVLAPHPDDEVFGCGGTLALHVLAGARVQVVICTSGEGAGVAAIRENESRQASKVLGYDEPIFWGLEDRSVLYGEALIQRIVDIQKSMGASIVYAPSLWENHPDHRTIAMAAMEAVRRCDDCELMCYEVGAPLRPNLLIDITSVREKKRTAMECFPSQLKLQRYDRHIEALNVFRSYTLSSGIQAAEAFECYDFIALRSGQLNFFASEYRRQQIQGFMAMPGNTPLVSVLIRSMDRPELDKTLDSVAVQTWPNVEVVIVNAKGSGHRSLPAWCGRFPLRLIDSDQPLHRSAAANRAMDCANGTALLLLDDDDWLDPDHLHKLATALQARPDAIAAVTGTRGVDTEGICVHEWKEPLVQRLMLVNQMPIMSVLFRKNTTANAPRFDIELEIFEDWDFWLQVHMQGKFVNVAGISANYLIRTTGGSGVHELEPSRRGHAQLRNKWRGRWPDVWFDALRTELDKGADQLHALQVEFNDFRKKFDVLPNKALHAEEERVVLHQEWDQHPQTFATLYSKLQHSRRRRAHLQAELNRHDLILGACKNENVQLSFIKEKLTRQLKEQAEFSRILVLQQSQEADRKLVVAKKERNNVTHELLLARQTLHIQSQKMVQIERMMASAEFRIKELIESSSWRITGPLRLLGKLVRNLRQT